MFGMHGAPQCQESGFEGIRAGGATTEGGNAFHSLMNHTLKTFRSVSRDGPGLHYRHHQIWHQYEYKYSFTIILLIAPHLI